MTSMQMHRRQPQGMSQAIAPEVTTPFGPEFQMMLFQMMLKDAALARALTKHIAPHFFQNEIVKWLYGTSLKYQESYGHLPSFAYLGDHIGRLDQQYRALYSTVLEQVKNTPVTDEAWLRERALDFTRRSIFRQAYSESKDLFSSGNYDGAYDLMQSRLDQIKSADFQALDRGWLAEDFLARNSARADRAQSDYLVPTGIPHLDMILGGGAYPGFLGTLIAYAKRGKSSLLASLGASTLRSSFKKVLHVDLESGRPIIEARYDTALSGDLYSAVKRGSMDSQRFTQLMQEMEYLRGLCVVRGFTDSWDVNVLSIEEELRDLKIQYGWVPDVIIVDYGDLLRAREKQQNETNEQIAAFKDLKVLARRGYRVWTASQARRPDNEKMHDTPHLLSSTSIADAFGKVRVCDLVASVNQTNAERQQKVLRLFVEMFRDGPCGITIPMHADFERMTFTGGSPIVAAAHGAMPMVRPLEIQPTQQYLQTRNGV